MSNQASLANIFDAFEETQRSSGKFLKLAPGEKRTLQFNMNKITIVVSEFEGKRLAASRYSLPSSTQRSPRLKRS